jgi:hypothetical protein
LVALELSKEVRVLEGIKMMVANGQRDQPGSGLDILGKAFTVTVSSRIFDSVVNDHQATL